MAEESKQVNPSVKWAQRKTTVYLTIDARDLAEENRSINLTPEGLLAFQGKNKNGDVEYVRELQLFSDVLIEESRWKVTDLCVQFSIAKKDKETQFWPRLLKEAGKQQWLVVDWDKWVDESDEEPEKNDFDWGDMEGFNDEEDSDDEDEAEATEEGEGEEAKANIEDLGV